MQCDVSPKTNHIKYYPTREPYYHCDFGFTNEFKDCSIWK